MPTGIPPKLVTRLLRIDGLAAFLAAIAAYAVIGGNWWLFALLLLAPDLSFLAIALGEPIAIRVYNVVHSYFLPIVLGAVGYATHVDWTVQVALIWVTHIGMDRAVGYGLKYPTALNITHLGPMGKARNITKNADAS